MIVIAPLPDEGTLEPLDVSLRQPFCSSETPTVTSSSLPTPQGDHPLLADIQECAETSDEPGHECDLQNIRLWPSDHQSSSSPALLPTRRDELPLHPPPAPLIKDMDSFGEGSNRGSFDFSLRSGSSTEQLSRSFSSLLSHSAPQFTRPVDVVTQEPPAPTSKVLDSITESSFEGVDEISNSSSSVDERTEVVPPNRIRSLSVAFSPDDPCRSIEIWRDDVLTSIQDGSLSRSMEVIEADLTAPATCVVEVPQTRVLKRHWSVLSDGSDFERRRRQMRNRVPTYTARISTFASVGSSNGSVRESMTPEMNYGSFAA